jgi:hypothetical protein
VTNRAKGAASSSMTAFVTLGRAEDDEPFLTGES